MISVTLDDIIVMILPIIIDNIYSLKTLNVLQRTNKSLNVATCDVLLLPLILKKMKPMTHTALRKLFVMPKRISFPVSSVFDAYQCAMVFHTTVRNMGKAFHVRQHRSASMKLSWKKRREMMGEAWQMRRVEVEQIYQDLCLVPCRRHVKSDAEVWYMTHGVVKRISRVYCDKRELQPHNNCSENYKCNPFPNNQVSWPFTLRDC